MNSLISHTIARKLIHFRKEKKWSQETIANLLQISQSSYARMEKGNCNSWVFHIEAICTLYAIHSNELLKVDNPTDSNTLISEQETPTIISKKLIEQYELRLQEKEDYIKKLEKLLNQLM